MCLPRDVEARDEPDDEVQPEDDGDAGDVRTEVASDDKQGTEQSEDRARCADDLGRERQECDRDRTAQRAEEVQRQKPPATEKGFEAAADQPQCQHVQADVPEARVHECDGEERPGLERHRKRRIDARRPEQQRTPDEIAEAGDQPQQERERGDRDDRVGDHRTAAVGGDRPGSGPAPLGLALSGRLLLPLLGHAFRTDDTDRPLGLALGTDRPQAPLAEHEALPVRVAIAVVVGVPLEVGRGHGGSRRGVRLRRCRQTRARPARWGGHRRPWGPC